VLVDIGDVGRCVEGALALLADRAKREATGEAARARVRRDYSVERMVKEYQKLYASIGRVRPEHQPTLP